MSDTKLSTEEIANLVDRAIDTAFKLGREYQLSYYSKKFDDLYRKLLDETRNAILESKA